MVPLNLTYLHCLQHSLYEHLFNLYSNQPTIFATDFNNSVVYFIVNYFVFAVLSFFLHLHIDNLSLKGLGSLNIAIWPEIFYIMKTSKIKF